MRFMVDAPLPPRLAAVLRDEGHDAVHVRDLQMQAAPDGEVLAAAADQRRTIVTLDLGFAAMLASRQLVQPSVLILRLGNVTADAMVRAAMRAVDATEDRLADGAVVTFDGKAARVRRLPI